MYISDIEAAAKRASRTAFVYLLVSLFCALFGAVYEVFSHEVYSFYMIYAFAFPLAGGTLPFFLLSMCLCQNTPALLPAISIIPVLPRLPSGVRCAVFWKSTEPPIS